MKTLKAFLSGFIAFALLQLFNIAYSFAFDILKIEQFNIDILWFFIIISTLFIGMIGGLIFISFTKIYYRLPFTNIYVQSGFYHALFMAILTIPLIIKNTFSVTTLVLVAASFACGSLSMYLYNFFTKKDDKT